MSRLFTIKIALLAFGCAGFFYWIQFSHPGIIGVDGYFHIRYAYLLRTEGLPSAFPWLTHSLLSENFADDHLGFHLLQIPFTFGDLIVGAKLYGLTFAVCAILLFYAILHRAQIRFAEVWVLLLLISAPVFLLRINMPRATGLSLCLLLLAFLLLLANRQRWLGPLAFVYAWSYGGFALILILVAVNWATSCVLTKEKGPQILVYCGMGALLGLVIHPYFPNDLDFLLKSYLEIESGFANHVLSGSEDYPYIASTAVRNASLIWVAVFIAVLPYLVKPKSLGQKTLTLFLFSIFLLCLYLNVRRFLEYWAPFALLFSAFALNPFLKNLNLRASIKTLGGISTAVALSLVCAWGIWDTVTHLARYRARDFDPQTYADASTFLRDNAPEGAVVFSADWDDFPLLFHYNTRSRYIVGLDPHYLYAFDPDLYDLWVEISDGDEPDAVAKIRDVFGAQYIFSPKDQKRFLRNLKPAQTALQTVFENRHAIVYEIPPASSSERHAQ